MFASTPKNAVKSGVSRPNLAQPGLPNPARTGDSAPLCYNSPMPSNASDLRILVVADDPLARAGLAALLDDELGCVVVAQMSSEAGLPERSIYIDPIQRASRHHSDSQIKIKAVLVPPHTHQTNGVLFV